MVPIEYATLGSKMPSATPVTVTVCGKRAFNGVKRTEFWLIRPSVASLLARSTLTFAVGVVLSFTVNVAVPPFSVVVRPLVGVTVTPAAGPAPQV